MVFLEALLPFLAQSKQTAIVFLQFSGQKEEVDNSNTVGYKTTDVFPFCGILLLDKKLPPQGAELGIVLLQFLVELVFAYTDIVQCAVIRRWLLQG